MEGSGHVHVGVGLADPEDHDHASADVDAGHHHSHLAHHFHAPSDASVVTVDGSASDDALEMHDGSCVMPTFLGLLPSFSWPVTAYSQEGVGMPLWICTSRTLARLERPPNGA